MSTPPPPPFGSAQPPYPGPAGYDRQTLKAQRRFAADQARLQREQLRRQMRAARRRSIVGPILLVALGTVLLLLQSGYLHWHDALFWLGRWWPAVLIVAGLVMVAEWTLDRRQVSSGGLPLAPRRFLGGGAAALLILLAVVGAGVMAGENGSAWARRSLDQNGFRNGFGDWRQVFGARSETSEEMRSPLAADGTLTVDGTHGDIAVTGSSDDGQVHVTVHRHVFAWQQSDMDARRNTEQVRFTGDRAHLVLTAPSQDQDDADLSIELPHGASISIRNDRGDVSLGELRGAVDVIARNGDVKLTALTGPVHLQTQDDDATVTAHSLGAGLTLDGRTGDINLSDVDGAVALHGDFFGTTHLERIRGKVHFQSSFTDFTCAGIPGDLNVEGRSDLDAHHLEGPVLVSTTNRNLSLDGVRGEVNVADRNGSVSVILAGSPAPLHVTNENGSVTVSVPANQDYAVQARTQNGHIENDFGLSPQTAGETSQLISQVGSGGPILNLQTTEGDLEIRKISAGQPETWDDGPQRLTSAPIALDKSANSHRDTR